MIPITRFFQEHHEGIKRCLKMFFFSFLPLPVFSARVGWGFTKGSLVLAGDVATLGSKRTLSIKGTDGSAWREILCLRGGWQLSSPLL